MKRHLIATVSGIALLFGAASMAGAADKTMQDKAAQPGTTTGAGTMSDTESKSLKKATPDTTAPGRSDAGTMSGTRSSSASDAQMRSYEDNKQDLAGVTVSGGLSADKLIGAEVVNASGEEIGEIEDLVVGSDNKVSQAIVEVGGFLGIGSKFVAVDIDKLQANSKGDGFMSNLTKEQLKTNAEYKKQDGHWVHSYK